jgi:hypothetical protein
MHDRGATTQAELLQTKRTYAVNAPSMTIPIEAHASRGHIIKGQRNLPPRHRHHQRLIHRTSMVCPCHRARING